MRERPDEADEALAHVRRSVRTVLEELSAVLTVLRRGDGPEPAPSRCPAWDASPGSLDSVAAAGLRVAHQQEGEARALPSAVDLAAYRIVQESLTNARKHGTRSGRPAPAQLRPRRAEISVENRAGPAPIRAGASGHGLTGMRERAASVGGTLDAGPARTAGSSCDAFLPAPVSEQVGT